MPEINVFFVDEKNAMAMAQFCKRVTYEDAYNRAHGETEEERKTMANDIFSGFFSIEKALRENGFSPR
jgi:hypothetical protein